MQKWIVIERSKLAARRRALQNISDIQTGADAYRGFLKDTQDSAEELLYAEARLGEMLKGSSKGTFKKGKEVSLPPDINKKQSHYAQTLNKNINSIAEVVAEAKEKDEIPTRSQVLRHIKRLRPETKPPPLPKGKYNVIYADPPWFYGQEQHSKKQQETVLETHYPTMSLKEICALNVQRITPENAVLFLWVTSPKLFEAKEVINSWGFSYRTSIVWDKVKHNVGYYVSVRHEFLLISIKGSFLPQSKKLRDSVVSIERTEHSRKPDYFRKLIEEMYPQGEKLELFTRKKTKGWTAYGNEVKGI